jgi:hypothetical protein
MCALPVSSSVLSDAFSSMAFDLNIFLHFISVISFSYQKVDSN